MKVRSLSIVIAYDEQNPAHQNVYDELINQLTIATRTPGIQVIAATKERGDDGTPVPESSDSGSEL